MPILQFFLWDYTLKNAGCCTESICQDNPDVAAHAKFLGIYPSPEPPPLNLYVQTISPNKTYVLY